MSDTRTMTLTEFILQRVAEDEADARAIPVGSWEDATLHGDHVLRWSPARVLAECEAKRRIVEKLRRAEDHVASVGGRHDLLHGLRFAGRALAAVYADHEDFRPEWRP